MTVNKALIKESVEQAGFAASWDFTENGIRLDGKEYELTPWRFHLRLAEIRKLALDQQVLRKNCSYKSQIVTHCSENISDVLYAEVDVCQWLLDDKIKYVYGFSHGDKTISVMAKTQSGILCQLEIAATLNDQTTPITRHEIVGKEDMICDRSINEQVPVEAVYAFRDDEKYPEAMTDTNLFTLGLAVEENQVFDNVIDLLIHRKNAVSEQEKTQNHNVICAIRESIRSGKRVYVKEGVNDGI